jgi:hypothetical protein
MPTPVQTEALQILMRGQKRLEDGQEKMAQQQTIIHEQQTASLAQIIAIRQDQAHFGSIIQDGLAAIKGGRIELWIKENPKRALELMSSVRTFVRSRTMTYVSTQNDPETIPGLEPDQYRSLVGAIIENGGGTLKDLDGMIVRDLDRHIAPGVWIGHLKNTSQKVEIFILTAFIRSRT